MEVYRIRFSMSVVVLGIVVLLFCLSGLNMGGKLGGFYCAGISSCSSCTNERKNKTKEKA